MKRSLILQNSIDELTKLATFIEELCEQWDLPMNISMNLNLALEEVFTNIVNYGFRDDAIHEIMMDFSFENNRIEIIIIDDGIAFNPLEEAPTPDLDASVEDRPIGGLGLHIVSEIMDRLEYKRENNKNIMHIYKEV